MSSGLEKALAFFTLLNSVGLLYVGYQNYRLGQENQAIQSMIYNYPPRIFIQAKDRFTLKLPETPSESGSGKANLTVTVITPHNGYVTIDQSSFNLSKDKYLLDLLDEERLESNNVKIVKPYPITVQQGTSEKVVEITFTGYVAFKMEEFRFHKGGRLEFGDIMVLITFFDVQSNRSYPHTESIPVYLEYNW